MNRKFLAEIMGEQRRQLTRLREAVDANELRQQALTARSQASRHRFREAFQRSASRRIKIIAEFKRRSPSLGVIRANASPIDIAAAYARGGASAISVLTETRHFGGNLDDLGAARAVTNLPLLRKDFILDPLQIYEAAIAGADAVLLIVAALDDDSLGQLRRVAEQELGMDALIEVHTSAELRRASAAGARLIGVNNRDLETFNVSISTSERLIAEAPGDAVMISESGLSDSGVLRRLADAGYAGFLIGETLMRAADPEAALQQLLESTT